MSDFQCEWAYLPCSVSSEFTRYHQKKRGVPSRKVGAHPITFRCRLLYPFSSEFPDNRETIFLTCHFYQLRCINEGSSKQTLHFSLVLDKAYNETKIRATGICRDSDKIVTTASAHAQPAALPLVWTALVILSYVIDDFFIKFK